MIDGSEAEVFAVPETAILGAEIRDSGTDGGY